MRYMILESKTAQVIFYTLLSSADNIYHRNVDGTQTEIIRLSSADNIRKAALFSQDWSLDPHALRTISLNQKLELIRYSGSCHTEQPRFHSFLIKILFKK